MPQLKPIIWVFSDLMIFMIFFMLVILYFYKKEKVNYSNLMMGGKIFYLKW